MNFIPYEVKFIINRLSSYGYEAYIVGGAVRDSILGRVVNDYDITTCATPEQIKFCFPDCVVIDTGIKHGTVTILIEDYPVEVTVFRTEGTYSDGRHPDEVNFTTSITEDLKRRDFTMNAIAYCPKKEYIDPFGGMDDIKNKTVRCVGEPKERFNEDKLRILRAVRFSSMLNFKIEEKTEKAILDLSGEINCVSKERIFTELCRLVCGPGVKNCLLKFKELIFNIIPELRVQDNYDQNNPNHAYPLYEHTVNCVSYAEPYLHIRLAALFHDIGKPECCTVDDKGISHFKGHPEKSEEAAREIMKRLHASTALTEKVCTLVKYHDVRLKPDKTGIKRFISKVGFETFFDLMKIQRADILSQAPKFYFRLDNINKLQELGEEIELEGTAFTVKDLKINGHDIIEAGFEEGERVGHILRLTLEAVLNGEVQNERSDLLKYISKL